MLVIEMLYSIPTPLAVVFAIAGVCAFFGALITPPAGVKQMWFITSVFIIGAVGMMSLLSRILLAAG